MTARNHLDRFAAIQEWCACVANRASTPRARPAPLLCLVETPQRRPPALRYANTTSASSEEGGRADGFLRAHRTKRVCVGFIAR